MVTIDENADTDIDSDGEIREFTCPDELYTDWDALRDSLIWKFKDAFGIGERRKPNEYYLKQLEVPKDETIDKKTSSSSRMDTLEIK